jgi:undecaprenyl pyrophosphate synthase
MQTIDWRAEAVRRGVDLTRLPRHIAMIMDGNGRWARARGLHRLVGHANGHSTVRRMVLGCAELGIEMLSLYTFSTENWRTPPRGGARSDAPAGALRPRGAAP